MGLPFHGLAYLGYIGPIFAGPTHVNYLLIFVGTSIWLNDLPVDVLMANQLTVSRLNCQ